MMPRNSNPVMFEQLEGRTLMSAAPLAAEAANARAVWVTFGRMV